METDEQRIMRCQAHELIRRLYIDKAKGALELLKAHCERGLEELAKEEAKHES